MNVTPEQARESLEHEPTLDGRADRRTYAAGTIATGLLIFGYFTLNRFADGSRWEDLVLVGYVLLLIGVAGWQSRALRAIPRHARGIGYVGLAGTLVAMVVGLGWINWLEHTGDPSTLLVVAIAAIIALPLTLAGLVILRGGGR